MLVNRALLSDHPSPTHPAASRRDGRRRIQESIVFSLWLLATSAAALATPDVVFAISFSLALFTTGIHLTGRR